MRKREREQSERGMCRRKYGDVGDGKKQKVCRMWLTGVVTYSMRVFN